MGRYRSRSYSPMRRRSRSPLRKQRYDEPRFRTTRSRHSPDPCGLLVRNISLDARPEDLRTPFERFGPIKDVYLPKNYYTGEPRGFGFVKFCNSDDAAEAKYELNHTIIGGREIAIVFAEENRKTPKEMRITTRPSGRYEEIRRRRTPPRSSRRRYRSYSRSVSPVRRDSRTRDRRARDFSSPSHSRSISRSVSPRNVREYRSKNKTSNIRDDDLSPPNKNEPDIDQNAPNPKDYDRPSSLGEGKRFSEKGNNQPEKRPHSKEPFRSRPIARSRSSSYSSR